MPIGDSELILNADGSVYHLNLLPDEIAKTIILVGDPERVPQVSGYFDRITIKKQKREFHTHTGVLNGKPLTVLSTGIGGGNIDIVLNELDTLVNIDFSTRKPKKNLTSLSLVRIGTSGAIQPNIPLNSFLLSEYAVGLNGTLHFYKQPQYHNKELEHAIQEHLDWETQGVVPYLTHCDLSLKNKFDLPAFQLGITVTSGGFYGPQGRRLRLQPSLADFHTKLASFRSNKRSITNIEMETASIYGLAALLGHKAISLNAILANRALQTFSEHPKKTVDVLIQLVLERLTKD